MRKGQSEYRKVCQVCGPLILDVKIVFRAEKTGVAAKDPLFGVAQPYDQGGVQVLLYYQHIDTFARSGSASQAWSWVTQWAMRLATCCSGRIHILPEGF